MISVILLWNVLFAIRSARVVIDAEEGVCIGLLFDPALPCVQ